MPKPSKARARESKREKRLRAANDKTLGAFELQNPPFRPTTGMKTPAQNGEDH
jgi:hypothetical protein